MYTILSFLNLQKYPPSLGYLLMTMGPALVLLGYLHKYPIRLAQPLTLFGRVPFFFYVLHMPLIHGLAIAYFAITLNVVNANWQMNGPQAHPEGYEPNLLLAYAVWAFIVVVMYYACRWFAGVKKRHNHWVLKYL
jgi:hypothetical protein